MYLAPAVRTMRDDPTEGASARLVVRVDADALPAAREAVTDVGTVESETRFDNLHATVPEPAVDDLLTTLPDAVEAVETRTTVAESTGVEE